MARSLYLLIGAILLSGCGHSRPPRWNASSHELCQGQNCYRVGQLGPEWQEVHKEGASVGFYNAGLGAVVQANATCRDDAEAAPLPALTRQLLIGYTERHQQSQEVYALAGREGLRTRVDAKLDGVPVKLDLIVLPRNGCIYDLSYVAPPDHFESGHRAFEQFVAGFADQRKSS
jgi:hypothetical protein